MVGEIAASALLVPLVAACAMLDNDVDRGGVVIRLFSGLAILLSILAGTEECCCVSI